MSQNYWKKQAPATAAASAAAARAAIKQVRRRMPAVVNSADTVLALVQQIKRASIVSAVVAAHAAIYALSMATQAQIFIDERRRTTVAVRNAAKAAKSAAEDAVCTIPYSNSICNLHYSDSSGEGNIIYVRVHRLCGRPLVQMVFAAGGNRANR